MEVEQDQNPESGSSKFRVNIDLIHSVEKQDQELELQELDITVYDHSTLGLGIIEQVKDALEEQSEEEGEIKDDTNEFDFNSASPSKPELIENRESNEGAPLDSSLFIENYLKKQSELASCRKFVKRGSKSLSIVSLENIPTDPSSNVKESQSKVRLINRPKLLKRKSKTSFVGKGKKKKSVSGDESEHDKDSHISSGSEYDPNDEEYSDEEDISPKLSKKNRVFEKRSKLSEDESESSWESSGDERLTKKKSKKELDDGDLDIYIKRSKYLGELNKEDFFSVDVDFRVPTNIWSKLFDYQKKGVKWLWGLHRDSFGGILGDEMGLGKTIQMISFLAGLHFSDEKDVEFNYYGLGPSIIVCPTTIMHQWVREFHNWYPQIRVAILHESGTFSGKSRKLLIKSINTKTRGILITSYNGLIQHKDVILAYPWHYVILDEGHKIRNPEAQITAICKNFDTNHKIILSGSPMQNNLKELWSLFDFIVPGKLGSLNIFIASFVNPIVQGGYANASRSQVLTAFKCATALRDTIKPFLLRRSKVEVDIQLPGKKEQVLFCKLTDAQRNAYLAFLRTLDINYVQNNKGRLFGALVTLRKICNHPDLYTAAFNDHYVLRTTPFDAEKGKEDDMGYWKRSGKMIVLVNLLKHWDKVGGQKVLIFTQGKKMMLILENFIKRSGYKYLKLDGGISIGARQPLIDKFNKDSSYFIMLLTTRVGGLGVNLTGANKVVIYDPDWNPATDAQARERAWRIGQSKDVCIYRLITTGTIEEKIYHRQIFKEFLSNKILKDPKQRRFFKSNDLMELFTLNETVEGGTSETAAIFAGTGSEIKYDARAAAKMVVKKAPEIPKIVFSKEKIEEMKRIAQEMSRRFVSLANSSKKIKSEPQEKELNETETFEEIYGPDGSLRVDVVKKLQKNCNNVELPKGPDLFCEDSSSSKADSKLDSKDVCDNIKTEADNSNTESSYIKSNSSEHISENESDYELSFSDILKQKVKSVDNAKKDSPPTPSKKSVKSTTEFKDLKNQKVKPKKSKRKDKSSKYATFEGEVVPHLVKYRKVKKKKEEEEEEKSYKNHDDYILHKLLKKSGIDTAMKHDTIMEDGPSDYTIVEEEASRVAEEAVKAIQQSYHKPDKQCSNPLMEEIMNKLKERNLRGFSCGPQAKALLSDLITHLNSMGGTASTNQVIDKFKDKVDAGQSPIFRKLLNSVATFYRGPDSQGYWSIKDEFKSLNL